MRRTHVKPKADVKPVPKVKKDTSTTTKKEEPPVKDVISAAVRSQRISDMASSLANGAVDKKTLVLHPKSRQLHHREVAA